MNPIIIPLFLITNLEANPQNPTFQQYELWQLKKNPQKYNLFFQRPLEITVEDIKPYQTHSEKSQVRIRRTPLQFQDTQFVIYEYDTESDTCIGWLSEIQGEKEIPIAEISDSTFIPLLSSSALYPSIVNIPPAIKTQTGASGPHQNNQHHPTLPSSPK
jgi:hypothetical protein